MPNFSELSYQKQIRFLRLLALEALKHYPLTVKKNQIYQLWRKCHILRNGY